VALTVKIVVGDGVDAEESLSRSGRLKALDLSLTPPCRLVAVLGPIVLSQSRSWWRERPRRWKAAL
jgi:hypothetical protein